MSPASLYGALGAPQPSVLANGTNLYLNPASALALVQAGLFPIGPVTTSPMGRATFPLPIPMVPALGGTELTVQALIEDPAVSGGFTTTWSMHLTLN